MTHVTDRRLLPRHVLLLLHHEAQVFLRSVRIFGVLENHHREHQHELALLAVQSQREVRMLDVLRHFLQLWIWRALCRVVDGDAVGSEEELPVEKRLVVVGIEPR